MTTETTGAPPNGGSDERTDPPGTDDPADPSNGPESGSQGSDSEPDQFPRAYVEQLREENARHRTRAARADEALTRLGTAAVREATAGILADSTDLTYDAETMSDDAGWPDQEKIVDAARELVVRKPHLADRRPTGDAGQGPRHNDEPVSLAGMLRARA